MGKRKVTILENAIEAVAQISFFVEAQGFHETAKKFVDDFFEFFDD